MTILGLVSATIEKSMGRFLERILPYKKIIHMTWVLKDELKHKFSPEF